MISLLLLTVALLVLFHDEVLGLLHLAKDKIKPFIGRIKEYLKKKWL